MLVEEGPEIQEEETFATGLSLLFQQPEINLSGEQVNLVFPATSLTVPSLKFHLKIPSSLDKSENSKLFAHLLWKASILLSLSLQEMEKTLLENLEILELGAGAGLPSIICALNGANDVVASDYPDKDLLDKLRENLQFNAPLCSNYRVIAHKWGDRGNDALFPSTPTPPSLKQFDLILMADTLWMVDQHEKLLRDLKALLKNGGKVLGTAGLHSGKEVFQSFFTMAEEKFAFKVTMMKAKRIPLGSSEFVEPLSEWCDVDDMSEITDDILQRQKYLFLYELQLEP